MISRLSKVITKGRAFKISEKNLIISSGYSMTSGCMMTRSFSNSLSTLNQVEEENTDMIFDAGNIETNVSDRVNLSKGSSSGEGPEGMSMLNNYSLGNEKNFYWNISAKSFDKSICDVLLAPVENNDVEIKPDGIIYLPEIKYRRILNKAFGPGGWALMPIRSHIQKYSYVYQEYALFCNGQFVSQAWGEQVFDETRIASRSLATALEGAKSNALMRCCKDIGIASELWDPSFIIQWREENSVDVWCEHVTTKKRRKLTRRKDRPPMSYPYREITEGEASSNETKYVVPSVNEPSEEGDISMFDNNTDDITDISDINEETPSAPKKKNIISGFDPNSIIQFGKYKGMSWIGFLKDPKSTSYLAYLSSNAKGELQETVKKAIEYKKSNGL